MRVEGSGQIREVVRLAINDSLIESEIDVEAGASDAWFQIDLSGEQNNGPTRLLPIVHDFSNKDIRVTGEPFEITVDTEGPHVESIVVDSKTSLVLYFREDDLAHSSIDAHGSDFSLWRLEGSGWVSKNVTAAATTPVIAPKQVAITVDVLEGRRYALAVTGVDDTAGNGVGKRSDGTIEEQKLIFDFTVGERRTGPHVEFPEFVSRHDRTRVAEFNPGDHVQTRVVRLYYYRDAHRVAQIINRNIQQYNRNGVDRAKQTAQHARRSFEDARDQRRNKENEAVRAADRTRRVERQLGDAEAQLEQLRARRGSVQTLDTQIRAINANIQVIEYRLCLIDARLAGTDGVGCAAPSNTPTPVSSGPVPDPIGSSGDVPAANESVAARTDQSRVLQTSLMDGSTRAVADSKATAELNRQKIRLLGEKSRLIELRQERTLEKSLLGDTAQLATAVTDANSTVRRLKFERDRLLNAEEKSDDAVKVAEQKEQSRSADRFRAEVAAAEEDPDTYVPGDVNSQDPVTQVSISVIGEGLIQLRGPMRGINDIRTMINQIDSPVGQVKVGIITVQINGEHGDRMENVAASIEGQIDLSRFLTNQSLQLMRRAVQEVAAQVIEECNHGNHDQHLQSDRDRRYVYAFFGRDFVDELYEMDSEFLRTENKLLSLHSMDTVSQSQAMFILSLARSRVRERILTHFKCLVRDELPQAEWDFRMASGFMPQKDGLFRKELKGHKAQSAVHQNAADRYTFRNFIGFFSAQSTMTDTMSPMQREFIRLAQIVKARMLAELELKQRVVERALIQQNMGDERARRARSITEHARLEEKLRSTQNRRQESAAYVAKVIQDGLISNVRQIAVRIKGLERVLEEQGVARLVNTVGAPHFYSERLDDTFPLTIAPRNRAPITLDFRKRGLKHAPNTGPEDKVHWQTPTCRPDTDLGDSPDRFFPQLARNAPNDASGKPQEWRCQDVWEFEITATTNDDMGARTWRGVIDKLHTEAQGITSTLDSIQFQTQDNDRFKTEKAYLMYLNSWLKEKPKEYHLKLGNVIKLLKVMYHYRNLTSVVADTGTDLLEDVFAVQTAIGDPRISVSEVKERIETLRRRVFATVDGNLAIKAEVVFQTIDTELNKLDRIETDLLTHKYLERTTRVDLDHKKLLDFLIDEQEEKFIELVERTRSHVAQVDNYLKRLAIALEDDFKVQFYDPAFRGVREASRTWDVNLAQIKRTTILTNNRAFAKVDPQATMEFELPKRAPAIVEAMQGTRAIMQDYGALTQDPTFIGLAGMLSGNPVVGGRATSVPRVQNVLPGNESSPMETVLAAGGGPDRRPGSNLEDLIPDPTIYKFETGTGFEIRPVIQPDGHSVIYDFDYMYTTNIREPVRADEKHLGRVKRHYINTSNSRRVWFLAGFGSESVVAWLRQGRSTRRRRVSSICSGRVPPSEPWNDGFQGNSSRLASVTRPGAHTVSAVLEKSGRRRAGRSVSAGTEPGDVTRRSTSPCRKYEAAGERPQAASPSVNLRSRHAPGQVEQHHLVQMTHAGESKVVEV